MFDLPLPQSIRFLNSKDRKKLLEALRNQFGVDELPVGAYFINAKDKVGFINKEVDLIPLDDLRIDSLGLYIGTWQRDGFRLSIEGSMMFAKLARKNIVFLSDEQMINWLKGSDIIWSGDEEGFVIVKHGNDVLGCGKIRINKDSGVKELLNYTPKARRLIVVNS